MKANSKTFSFFKFLFTTLLTRCKICKVRKNQRSTSYIKKFQLTQKNLKRNTLQMPTIALLALRIKIIDEKVVIRMMIPLIVEPFLLNTLFRLVKLPSLSIVKFGKMILQYKIKYPKPLKNIKENQCDRIKNRTENFITK